MDSLAAARLILPRDDTDACEVGNEYDGRMGLRVAALFIIWVTSTLGAAVPVFAHNNKGSVRIPEASFFVCKYFGSGVIIATAFIHLLGPAVEALTDACLTGPITEYSWVEGIVLMTIFGLFFVELMVLRYGRFGGGDGHDQQQHGHMTSIGGTEAAGPRQSPYKDGEIYTLSEVDKRLAAAAADDKEEQRADTANPFSFEDYKAQMTAIFILEFGIIFHSIFIGLTLAVAGSEFDTLFVVLIFHQTFEGLGLGSRLAVTPWRQDRRWTPYALACMYGLSTPLAIGVGLGVRRTYPPGSQTTLIVNGIFDSVSAGILIYTGLVELMAHEFMFGGGAGSNSMRTAKIQTVLAAFALMCLGAGLMAALGKWA